MGKLSIFTRNKLLDHICNTAYTPPTTVYLAFCSADPTESGTGDNMNEMPDTANYSRKAIAFGAAASRRVTQNANVGFDQLSDNLGTATHWAIVDSPTHSAGNMLAFGELDEAKELVANNTPSVASGEVWVEITANEVSNYLANTWLDFMFRNQAFSKPDTYAGYATATLSDTTTGSTVTEPAGGYARVQVNPNSGSNPKWTLAANGELANAAAITFPTATASQGTLTSVFVADAATGGNILMYDNDVADQAVGTGDTIELATGDMKLNLNA